MRALEFREKSLGTKCDLRFFEPLGRQFLRLTMGSGFRSCSRLNSAPGRQTLHCGALLPRVSKDCRLPSRQGFLGSRPQTTGSGTFTGGISYCASSCLALVVAVPRPPPTRIECADYWAAPRWRLGCCMYYACSVQFCARNRCLISRAG